ncbi:AraC-type DNA-binding protein [Oceanospirillum multiglobuliferum]|uniref:HTH araC/xylS-type domain-containing protein n=1 Tax=Oceanospirillum multiglobuliferum TaxID=64969 RepID=A0A1T4KVJ1_9GAMM|nr:AraC family transcriptional regulator [Oceanospirillum multiglobuliferum]OPX54967.1 hypothetical protein BTE48_11545 [Oceanospirillum multiglobuliferum]SJZ46449.1 AraC-type DNA-binding protein [Oceanospirillum multiglobuliferum]
MPENKQASIMGSWAVVIGRALEYYQLEGAVFLERVGIDQQQANHLDTRYSLHRIDRLWRLARNVTQDEAFGLTVARFMRPTSWHALGFAIWASDTLMEGFGRLAQNLRMFADYADMTVLTKGDRVEIELNLREGIDPRMIPPEACDAFIGTCVLTARHIYRPDFGPQSIWLSRPQPQNPTPWTRLFKCPVYFNSASDRIIFNTSAMFQPLLTASPELAAQNDVLVANYLARMDQKDLLARIQALLVQHEPIGTLTLMQLAEHLNLSQRTLQRRLQKKGQTYQQLLDDVRQKQALHWLRLNHLSMGEISYRLGFTHLGNFCRAFKRWYGESPTQTRKRLMQNLD